MSDGQASGLPTDVYLSVVQHAPDGIAVVDEDGHILEANAHLCELAGYARTALIGALVERLIAPDLHQRHLALRGGYATRPRRRPMASGRVLSLHRSDGVDIPVEISLSPTHCHGRALTIAVVRDMRNLVGAQRELQRQSTELQEAVQRISSQNADLTRLARELEGLRDEAVAAAAAKSLFLATMSHEIRTPLNGVYGMLQLLKTASLDAEARDQLGVALQSAESLLSLVSDVLDWSKIEAATITAARQPFRIRRAVEDGVRLYCADAHGKGLVIESVISPAVPDLCVGDEKRFRQVLANLVGNAVKFTDRGHVVVRVNAMPDGDGSVLTVRVHDTGCGLPAEAIRLLFRPFVQVGSTAQTRRGTGLGLAISKRLVEAMDGRISARSELGAGSVFEVVLPLVPAAVAVDAGDGAEAALSGVRVLIAGCDPSVAAALECRLVRDGAAVEVTGPVRVAAVAGRGRGTSRYDLVFLAAGADARTRSRALRAAAQRAHRVIAVRPLASSHEAAIGQRAVSTPVRDDELRDACTAALARRAATSAPRRPDRDATDDASPQLAGVRVLVVDDDDASRLLAATIARRRGADVVAAGHGLDALSILSERPVDVVLMDCRMPKLDGYATTRRMRGELGLRVPVIALTASLSELEREECFACGMQEVLSKPIRAEALEQALLKWARHKARHARAHR